MKDDDSSEWEYEYDDTETESFYVTLDLPAPLSHPKQKANSHRAASTPVGSTAHADLDPDELGTDPPEEQESADQIQILDLHTKNPIISYQNQIFSCQWTSTIGTDLLLASPESECSFPKLLEGDGFNILAATNIKIIGQPVELAPRYHAAVSEPAEVPAEAIPSQPEIQNTIAEPAEEASIRIPVGPESGRARQNQARFLERLMAAKSAKGDTDIIPLHPRKNRTGSGWRSWQRPDDDGDAEAHAAVECQADAANDEEDSEDEYQYGQHSSERSITSSPQQSSPRGIRFSSRGVGRPRGSRRRTQTRGRAIGGLFRDYRPNAGDAQGADIRGSFPISTPRTWGELGAPATVGSATVQTMQKTGPTGGEAEGDPRQRDTTMEDVVDAVEPADPRTNTGV